MWTKESLEALGANIETEDGTFWMSYQDFVNYFKAVSICKVRNWDEVRIKGKFVRVQDIDDPNIEVVLSKWYYSVSSLLWSLLNINMQINIPLPAD
jgi:calpain-15